MRKLGFTLLLAAAAVPASAANLVTNGSFSAGNTGFTSGYTYVAPTFNSMYPEATYTIGTDASAVHDQWEAVKGVGGSGKFMIVNGATTAGADVWRSGAIAVDADTDYFFESFATNLCCNAGRTGAGSLLTFRVVGDVTGTTDLATFSTEDTAVGVWKGLSTQWNSGANTSAQLFLVNASTDFFGNDFAVDNINFGVNSAIPEPATWAMMLGGFGLVGAATRRRAKPVVTFA